MSVDLQRLIHLEAVYRLKSFSRAADELGRTQPTISRSIAHLEELWKVRLFDRDLSGVTPTKVGMELIVDVERLLGQVRDIDHNMGVRANGGGGSVDFGIAPLVGAIATSQTLAQTFRTHPALLVKVRMEPLADLLAHLKSGAIDFAIFSETKHPSEPDLVFETVGSIPLGIVVRQNHPIGQLENPGIQDLYEYPMVTTTYMRDYGNLPQPALVCDNHSVLKTLVLSTDFVWFTSPLIFRGECRDGRAIIIDINGGDLPKRTDIFIAHKKSKIISPASRNVLGCAINVLHALMTKPAIDLA